MVYYNDFNWSVKLGLRVTPKFHAVPHQFCMCFQPIYIHHSLPQYWFCSILEDHGAVGVFSKSGLAATPTFSLLSKPLVNSHWGDIPPKSVHAIIVWVLVFGDSKTLVVLVIAVSDLVVTILVKFMMFRSRKQKEVPEFAL